MKSLSIGYFFLVLFFGSCKQDDTNGFTIQDNGFEPPENSFLASIEGIALNSDALEVFSDSLRLTITARNTTTNQKLQLFLPENVTPQSYEYSSMLQSNTALGIYYPDDTSETVFRSESGILNITELNEFDNFIKGNTVFTAANPTGDGVIEITFCEFEVMY